MSANRDLDDATAARLLGDLGARVRSLRATRQMTRKALAQASGVSERYLAQLERGRGNVSILLLAKVAAALGVEPQALLRLCGDRSAEEVLIADLLHDVGPDMHRSILKFLSENYSVPLAARRRVALVGLRGAGKTSVGKILAEQLGVSFVQLGVEIELLAGMSTSEIFSLSGQAGYRRLEEKALMQALGKHERCVLETGGSIVLDPMLLDTLLSTCFVAWLHAKPEEHMRRLIKQGDVRPMQNQDDALADLRRIVAERNEFYARAHTELDTNGKRIEECVAELMRSVPAGMRGESTNLPDARR
jgi:XRE family aerobic/anaerobic benzoate catabolism transcriptional regulator